MKLKNEKLFYYCATLLILISSLLVGAHLAYPNNFNAPTATLIFTLDKSNAEGGWKDFIKVRSAANDEVVASSYEEISVGATVQLFQTYIVDAGIHHPEKGTILLRSKPIKIRSSDQAFTIKMPTAFVNYGIKLQDKSKSAFNGEFCATLTEVDGMNFYQNCGSGTVTFRILKGSYKVFITSNQITNNITRTAHVFKDRESTFTVQKIGEATVTIKLEEPHNAVTYVQFAQADPTADIIPAGVTQKTFNIKSGVTHVTVSFAPSQQVLQNGRVIKNLGSEYSREYNFRDGEARLITLNPKIDYGKYQARYAEKQSIEVCYSGAGNNIVTIYSALNEAMSKWVGTDGMGVWNGTIAGSGCVTSSPLEKARYRVEVKNSATGKVLNKYINTNISNNNSVSFTGSLSDDFSVTFVAKEYLSKDDAREIPTFTVVAVNTSTGETFTTDNGTARLPRGSYKATIIAENYFSSPVNFSIIDSGKTVNIAATKVSQWKKVIYEADIKDVSDAVIIENAEMKIFLFDGTSIPLNITGLENLEKKIRIMTEIPANKTFITELRLKCRAAPVTTFDFVYRMKTKIPSDIQHPDTPVITYPISISGEYVKLLAIRRDGELRETSNEVRIRVESTVNTQTAETDTGTVFARVENLFTTPVINEKVWLPDNTFIKVTGELEGTMDFNTLDIALPYSGISNHLTDSAPFCYLDSYHTCAGQQQQRRYMRFIDRGYAQKAKITNIERRYKTPIPYDKEKYTTPAIVLSYSKTSHHAKHILLDISLINKNNNTNIYDLENRFTITKNEADPKIKPFSTSYDNITVNSLSDYQHNLHNPSRPHPAPLWSTVYEQKYPKAYLVGLPSSGEYTLKGWIKYKTPDTDEEGNIKFKKDGITPILKTIKREITPRTIHVTEGQDYATFSLAIEIEEDNEKRKTVTEKLRTVTIPGWTPPQDTITRGVEFESCITDYSTIYTVLPMDQTVCSEGYCLPLGILQRQTIIYSECGRAMCGIPNINTQTAASHVAVVTNTSPLEIPSHIYNDLILKLSQLNIILPNNYIHRSFVCNCECLPRDDEYETFPPAHNAAPSLIKLLQARIYYEKYKTATNAPNMDFGTSDQKFEYCQFVHNDPITRNQHCLNLSNQLPVNTPTRSFWNRSTSLQTMNVNRNTNADQKYEIITVTLESSTGEPFPISSKTIDISQKTDENNHKSSYITTIVEINDKPFKWPFTRGLASQYIAKFKVPKDNRYNTVVKFKDTILGSGTGTSPTITFDPAILRMRGKVNLILKATTEKPEGFTGKTVYASINPSYLPTARKITQNTIADSYAFWGGDIKALEVDPENPKATKEHVIKDVQLDEEGKVNVLFYTSDIDSYINKTWIAQTIKSYGLSAVNTLTLERFEDAIMNNAESIAGTYLWKLKTVTPAIETVTVNASIPYIGKSTTTATYRQLVINVTSSHGFHANLIDAAAIAGFTQVIKKGVKGISKLKHTADVSHDVLRQIEKAKNQQNFTWKNNYFRVEKVDGVTDVINLKTGERMSEFIFTERHNHLIAAVKHIEKAGSLHAMLANFTSQPFTTLALKALKPAAGVITGLLEIITPFGGLPPSGMPIITMKTTEESKFVVPNCVGCSEYMQIRQWLTNHFNKPKQAETVNYTIKVKNGKSIIVTAVASGHVPFKSIIPVNENTPDVINIDIAMQRNDSYGLNPFTNTESWFQQHPMFAEAVEELFLAPEMYAMSNEGSSILAYISQGARDLAIALASDFKMPSPF